LSCTELLPQVNRGNNGILPIKSNPAVFGRSGLPRGEARMGRRGRGVGKKNSIFKERGKGLAFRRPLKINERGGRERMDFSRKKRKNGGREGGGGSHRVKTKQVRGKKSRVRALGALITKNWEQGISCIWMGVNTGVGG